MVRILLTIYVITQVLLLVQIKHASSGWFADFASIIAMLPGLDTLKIIEIFTFIPIILILAQRTRELRKEVFHKDHLGPEIDL